MKTIFELMTALSAFDKSSVDMAAKAAAQSGITGAKDLYMAWGKEKGIVAKALEQEWKDAQPEKAAGGGAKGFADTYYDWLAEGTRTEQDAADLILSNESQNVRNHLTHYLNIWALAETVRAGKKVARTITAGKASPKPEGSSSAQPKSKAKAEPEWEYDASHPYQDVRSAKETLKRNADSKRPSKTKVHPDKVAHLNDAELSKMYTSAFQNLNK